MKDIKTITIWGDSVMRGVIYDDSKCRYTLLDENSADAASQALGLTLNNRARMGCTVTKGLSILKRDLMGPINFDAALIEFGGNDCDYNWEQIAANPDAEHQPKTPLTLFTSQLREMVKMLGKRGIMPVMMTLPPIDAERYFQFVTQSGLNKENILRWLGDVQHIYRWHERYNAATIQVAEECGCPIAHVREAFLDERCTRDLICADGIHPNAKGHALMEKILKSFGEFLQHQQPYAI